jgi:hypothetical protein
VLGIGTTPGSKQVEQIAPDVSRQQSAIRFDWEAFDHLSDEIAEMDLNVT